MYGLLLIIPTPVECVDEINILNVQCKFLI